MAAYSELYNKAGELMRQAIEAYGQGDFDKGEELREKANKIYDNAEGQVNSDEGKINMLYGECKNFGIAYNIFEQSIVNLLKQKNGKKIIKEFYETIKGDKILNEQFKTYDAFENYNGNDTDSFVNESCSIMSYYTPKQLSETNMKLINLIRKYKLNEYIDLSSDKENLYEAIENIFTHKGNINGVAKTIESREIIKEYINKHKKDQETVPTLETVKEDADKIDESIENDLVEEERNLIEKYLSPETNRERFFNEQKQKTLAKINEARNSSSAEDRTQWDNVYNKVMNKTFTEDDGLSLCAEMIEIYNTI